MVEHESKLNTVFQSLSDPTRRDILRRVAREELSVSDVARSYERHMSFAAVSKHLQILENARLIKKRRVGRQQLVALSPPALKDAAKYIARYEELWEERLNRLEKHLTKK